MHEVEVKGILSSENGMNIYRGCTHGCIYCDSRSTCYGMEHAFEDVEVKKNAVSLLKDALTKKRKKCMIGTGSMSDPYMPLEEKTQNMRKCLKLIDRYGFGATLITKSDLILRDLDLLASINKKTKCVVQMTLTTYDENLCRILEPNVATTKQRFEVLQILRDNGIPTVVWLSPILPFINDDEENINGILDYCIKANVKGIICFGMGLTLRDGNRQYFYAQLDKYFPGLKDRYIKTYGNAYQLASPNNDKLMQIFYDRCKRHRIMTDAGQIFCYLRQFEEKTKQMSLFD